MAEKYPSLLEESFRIAWDYLNQAGEIQNRDEAAIFLNEKIEMFISAGTLNRLVLSNRAILAYKVFTCERREKALAS